MNSNKKFSKLILNKAQGKTGRREILKAMWRTRTGKIITTSFFALITAASVMVTIVFELPAYGKYNESTHGSTINVGVFEYTGVSENIGDADLNAQVTIATVTLAPDMGAPESVATSSVALNTEASGMENPKVNETEQDGDAEADSEIGKESTVDAEDTDEERLEGYTITIYIKGEDGMAVIMQNGDALTEDPLKPNIGEYIINELSSGEMIVLAASPYNPTHFIRWSAYLTDDDSELLPLPMNVCEPPAETRLFIMPEADITIEIEFTEINTNA